MYGTLNRVYRVEQLELELKKVIGIEEFAGKVKNALYCMTTSRKKIFILISPDLAIPVKI